MIRLLVKTASGFLSVDDLTHNDFLSSKLTGIHLHHPFKQIGSFQLFINTTGFGELSGDQPHLFLRRDVDVMEIYIQTTPRQKCGVGAFPVIKALDNFPDIVQRWESGTIRAREAAELCGMCESTFYHRLREYRASLGNKK